MSNKQFLNTIIQQFMKKNFSNKDSWRGTLSNWIKC